MESMIVQKVSTHITARIITEPSTVTPFYPLPKSRRGLMRVARLVAASIITLLIGFMSFMGLTGGQPAANAIGPCPFSALVNPGPEGYRTGVEALVPHIDPITGNVVMRDTTSDSYTASGIPVTAYEWLGTGGLIFSQYTKAQNVSTGSKILGAVTGGIAGPDDGCWAAGNYIGNLTANTIFDVDKAFTTLSIGMYQWASSADLLSDFLKPIDCLIKGCGGAGLKDTLYLNYLAPVVVMGALWGAWVGIVKKRTTEAAQGAIWMFVAAGLSLAFLAQPSAVASFANSLVSTITSTAMSAVTSGAAGNPNGQDICALPDGSVNRGPRMASCSLYKVLLFTPWSSGQFGSASATFASKEGVKFGGSGTEFHDLRLTQLTAQAINHDEASGDYTTIKKAHDDTWLSVADQVSSQSYNSTWRGENPGSRLNIAFASLLAALSAGLLLLIISFAMVVLGFALIMLTLLAPIFLLIGVHPGFGRGIALKWLELYLGTIVKRIVLGVFLSVLMGMYQIILSTDMAWFAQIAMIMGVGIGALIYRKPIMEAFSIKSLGGSATGLERGGDREMKRGASFAVGAIAGGVMGGRSGVGGVVKGAASGGMRGSRSGSPLRAATMGASAGRRVSSRSKSKGSSKSEAAADRAAEYEEEEVWEEDYAVEREEQRRRKRSRDQTSPRPTTRTDEETGAPEPSGSRPSPWGGAPLPADLPPNPPPTRTGNPAPWRVDMSKPDPAKSASPADAPRMPTTPPRRTVAPVRRTSPEADTNPPQGPRVAPPAGALPRPTPPSRPTPPAAPARDIASEGLRAAQQDAERRGLAPHQRTNNNGTSRPGGS